MSTRSLEIDGLHKRYGDVVALHDMSFEVRPGEIFGFVGGNGAGKTTTMRIALGVLSADAGEVRWDGSPVDLGIWRRIGYMPEERGLYPKMKVQDQLVYLAQLHGFSTKAAIRSSDVWTERLGIADRRKDEIQKLSLGNQQRVQLAAALIHDPQALILDEPFSGLDPVAVDVMSEVLRDKAAEGVPVMFSSHQLELVERLCDRVGIVANGTMTACGTVDELRSKSSVQIAIDAPNAQPGWSDAIPGVSFVRKDGANDLFKIDNGTDDQQLLLAALQTGPVRSFAPRRPTLTELFRDVVSDAQPKEEASK